MALRAASTAKFIGVLRKRRGEGAEESDMFVPSTPHPGPLGPHAHVRLIPITPDPSLGRRSTAISASLSSPPTNKLRSDCTPVNFDRRKNLSSSFLANL